ncbi:MAG: alkaline phosphatase family protein [Chloroflexota bacterium]|nr:alkaline phosphatase family protein [Chloroflexota bacterium]
MIKPTLLLIIDGFAHDYLNHVTFLNDFAHHNSQAKLIPGFGFQPVIASILTGTYPVTNNVWNNYIYDRNENKSVWLKSLWALFQQVDRIPYTQKLVRYGVSALSYPLVGFFPPVNYVPFNRLRHFNISMKCAITERNAIAGITSLFDTLRNENISFKYIHGCVVTSNKQKRISYPISVSDKTTYKSFIKALEPRTSFYMVYFTDVDRVGHAYGPKSPKLIETIRSVDQYARDAIAAFESLYGDTNIIVMSDHGMAEIHNHIDIEKIENNISLKAGRDYMVFLDSMMARFWYENETARAKIRAQLQTYAGIRLISDEEKVKYKINFDHDLYGEDVFVADPDTVIMPNYFQRSSVKGMHGYGPGNEATNGIFMLNREGFQDIEIEYIDAFPTMLEMMSLPIPASNEGKSALSLI